MKRNCVNVLSVINSESNITEQDVNGKPHIVVRGVTPVVDDIVMNRKLYPAAEIEKGYKTLERTPMPLGHPKVNGKHVSARDVQAVNDYHVGAWFQNVVHTNGKESGDIYVDCRYAEGTVVVTLVDNVAVTGVTLSPATSTGAAGGTSTFTVTVLPANATNKAFNITPTDATKATATAAGNVVTVNRVATGSGQIIVSTVDGNKVAAHTADFRHRCTQLGLFQGKDNLFFGES